MLRTLLSMIAGLLGIVAAGAVGGGVGYVVSGWLGLDGVGAALVALVVAMVVATALWAGGSALLRSLGLIR
jgi:hypothetical protein